MSYEGFVQNLCINGHYFETAAQYLYYADEEEAAKCPVCGEKSVWENSVDDTNCDSCGYIPLEKLELISPQLTQKCNLGHVHVIEEETYKVPTPEETKKLRHFFDQETLEYLPLDKYPG